MNKKAFSMIEMMIAVAITAVCMVMVLMVFSICASAVSTVYKSTHSMDIFQKKMDEIQLNSILSEGVEIAFAQTDYIEVQPGREFKFNVNTVPWLSPIPLVIEGEIPKSEGRDEPKEPETELCVVQSEVVWEEYGRQKSVNLEAVFPSSHFLESGDL
ncbi:MAG: prepilin-type N-terminal cleavage/methylation domain-containing protein [Candidatus Omnitrophota bacterium]